MQGNFLEVSGDGTPEMMVMRCWSEYHFVIPSQDRRGNSLSLSLTHTETHEHIHTSTHLHTQTCMHIHI